MNNLIRLYNISPRILLRSGYQVQKLLNQNLNASCLKTFNKYSSECTNVRTNLKHDKINTRLFSTDAPKELDKLEENNSEEVSPDTVKITYIDRDGERHDINGKVGDNVMYLSQRFDLDIEGACEASLACCTCHVYVKEKYFDILGEPTEEEEDMLDLAPFLQENSRLSCQIILSKELDGIEVKIPSATRNFYVDGHKPKPH